VRDQQQAFAALVAGDFSGPGNFLYWIVALAIVGAIGYLPKAKPISNLFIVLILLVLILNRGNPKTGAGGGVFQQLQAALGTSKQPSAAAIASGAANLVSTATGLGGS
jgi:hypothetical protein